MDNRSLEEINQEIDRILEISLAERIDTSNETEEQKYCWICFAGFFFLFLFSASILILSFQVRMKRLKELNG